MDVNHENLKEMIEVSYENKLPVHIKGHIGIGKSDTVKDVSKELAKKNNLEFVEGVEEGKFGFVDIRLSQLEPSDLRGLPMYNKTEKTTEWYVPSWFPSEGKGIMFFDELNLAPPSIQAAAYQLILNRRIGDYKLPEGWSVMAAGNGSEDKANVFEIPAPLANRFIHVTLNPPSDEAWTEWALDNKINSDIIAYINFQPSKLYKFEENMKSLAFPTPRSWEFCSRLITDYKGSNEKMLISSAIGDGTATEFLAFRKLRKNLDIDKILNDPNNFKNPVEVDMKYALISAMSERYSKKKKTILPNIVKIWTKMDPEFVVLSLKLIKKDAGYNLGPELFKIKEWKALANDYSKYFL